MVLAKDLLEAQEEARLERCSQSACQLLGSKSCAEAACKSSTLTRGQGDGKSRQGAEQFRLRGLDRVALGLCSIISVPKTIPRCFVRPKYPLSLVYLKHMMTPGLQLIARQF